MNKKKIIIFSALTLLLCINISSCVPKKKNIEEYEKISVKVLTNYKKDVAFATNKEVDILNFVFKRIDNGVTNLFSDELKSTYKSRDNIEKYAFISSNFLTSYGASMTTEIITVGTETDIYVVEVLWGSNKIHNIDVRVKV